MSNNVTAPDFLKKKHTQPPQVNQTHQTGITLPHPLSLSTDTLGPEHRLEGLAKIDYKSHHFALSLPNQPCQSSSSCVS